MFTFSLPNHALWLLRVAVAAVWLYEGLWLKVLQPSPHEVAIVRNVVSGTSVSPTLFLALIGIGETLLALAILSGLFARPLAWLQATLLIGMNALGILLGRGAITQPFSLLIHNLPMLACIALLGLSAPRRNPARETATPVASGAP